MKLFDKLSLGFILGTSSIIIAQGVSLSYRDYQAGKRDEEIIRSVIDKAAGEDKILTTGEKAGLIRDLGLSYTIQEGEGIGIKGPPFFGAYYKSDFDIYAGDNDAGTVDRKTL